MYETRRPLYEAFCDCAVDNDRTVEHTLETLLEVLA